MSRSGSMLLAVLLLLASPLGAQDSYDVIIRNGRVLDGTGNPWFYADVAIQGDRIAAIGDLSQVRAQNEIDATGLLVTPGDTGAFVSAVVRVLRDSELAARLGAAAQESMRSEYAWRTLAEKVERTYVVQHSSIKSPRKRPAP